MEKEEIEKAVREYIWSEKTIMDNFADNLKIAERMFDRGDIEHYQIEVRKHRYCLGILKILASRLGIKTEG